VYQNSIADAGDRCIKFGLPLTLALNHQRHAEEASSAAAQAHLTHAKRGRKQKDTSGQATMDF
jgi:hypothetical protein